MRIEFETVPDCYAEYGEPCNNCRKMLPGKGWWCDFGHRQKKVEISTGHMNELIVRKRGGCPDHELLHEEDDTGGDGWFFEEVPYRTTGVYGGSRTSIL